MSGSDSLLGRYFRVHFAFRYLCRLNVVHSSHFLLGCNNDSEVINNELLHGLATRCWQQRQRQQLVVDVVVKFQSRSRAMTSTQKYLKCNKAVVSCHSWAVTALWQSGRSLTAVETYPWNLELFGVQTTAQLSWMKHIGWVAASYPQGSFVDIHRE